MSHSESSASSTEKSIEDSTGSNENLTNVRPKTGPVQVDSPHGTVMHGAGNAQASINDRAGLYVGIMGVALAALALGILAMLPAFIDAKIQAGVAKAEATAHAAEVNARVSIDKVDTMRIKLAEQRINLDDH